MTLEIKELELGEDYSYKVRVKDRVNVFSGLLSLKKDICTLSISTERTPSESFRDIKEIVCDDYRNKFLLYDLELWSFSNSFLQTVDGVRVYLTEITFKIGFVICTKNMRANTSDKFSVIELESLRLNDWVGITSTRFSMLNEDEDSNFSEFITAIERSGNFGLSYRKTNYYNLTDLKSGTYAVPILYRTFASNEDFNQFYIEFLKIYELMALYFGGDFKLKNVRIFSRYHPQTIFNCYFSTNFQVISEPRVILPLGMNLSNNHYDLTPIPMLSFNKYFSLNQEDLSFFSKYMRYKRMHSDEEKFLGYFRLLEKLCKQEKLFVPEEELNEILQRSKKYLVKKLGVNSKTINSLIARIIYANKTKYDTNTCLSLFYDVVPVEIRDTLGISKEEIIKIVRLRNDITHANPIQIDDDVLSKYTVFIHALLFMKLLTIIDIPLAVCIPVARRFNNFH